MLVVTNRLILATLEATAGDAASSNGSANPEASYSNESLAIVKYDRTAIVSSFPAAIVGSVASAASLIAANARIVKQILTQ